MRLFLFSPLNTSHPLPLFRDRYLSLLEARDDLSDLWLKHKACCNIIFRIQELRCLPLKFREFVLRIPCYILIWKNVKAMTLRPPNRFLFVFDEWLEALWLKCQCDFDILVEIKMFCYPGPIIFLSCFCFLGILSISKGTSSKPI